MLVDNENAEIKFSSELASINEVSDQALATWDAKTKASNRILYLSAGFFIGILIYLIGSAVLGLTLNSIVMLASFYMLLSFLDIAEKIRLRGMANAYKVLYEQRHRLFELAMTLYDVTAAQRDQVVSMYYDLTNRLSGKVTPVKKKNEYLN